MPMNFIIEITLTSKRPLIWGFKLDIYNEHDKIIRLNSS